MNKLDITENCSVKVVPGKITTIFITYNNDEFIGVYKDSLALFQVSASNDYLFVKYEDNTFKIYLISDFSPDFWIEKNENEIYLLSNKTLETRKRLRQELIDS